MKSVLIDKGDSYNGKCIREGECPYCGSDDWQTLDQGIEADIYFYDMKCNKCDGRWEDIYRMTFLGMQIKLKETDQ